MKSIIAVVTAILLAASLTALKAEGPAGTGDVVLSFTGGATWIAADKGICIWALPLVGDEGLLVAGSPNGQTLTAKDAYFMWVSQFSVQMVINDPKEGGSPYKLAFVPSGTATIYYRRDPGYRVFPDQWTDLDQVDKSTWGVQVATFVRKASFLRSPDSFASDTFIFAADLVSSTPVTLPNYHKLDFRNLIPNGMTCFEYGQAGSSWEAGSCVAKGK